MRIGWIDDLWETSQTTMGRFSALSRDSVNSYALRVFEGLVSDRNHEFEFQFYTFKFRKWQSHRSTALIVPISFS